MQIKRNNISRVVGGIGGGSNSKSTSRTQTKPPVTNKYTPIVTTFDYSYCGASTSTTIDVNLLNELTLQQILTTTSKTVDYKTNDLFNTVNYYGYIIYPSKYGVLNSLKQNSGEEQLNAWINLGVNTIDGVEYLIYRTSVPKAYQTNQTLNCN